MMSETNSTIIPFIIGACIGSVCTWLYASDKYKRIAQEEIDSVKDVFYKRVEYKSENIVDSKEDDSVETKVNRDIYNSIINKQNYTKYSNKDGETEVNKHKRPYVLSPQEYDDSEYDHYEKISLNYYSDLILTNENNEIVEDVEGLIGFESLSTFGRYEDDSVFVRNDTLECDFEILLDQRTYSESVPKKIRKLHEVD